MVLHANTSACLTTKDHLMRQHRAWIMFRSGNRIDLLNLKPNAWTDADIAIGLSRTYRWGGRSAWDLPLSVAQHSLTVLALAEASAEAPLPLVKALRELLHDGTEALMGGIDPISTLRPHLGAKFALLEKRLQAVIDKRYSLPGWMVHDHAQHKHADRLAAASKAFHVVGWRKPALRKQLGIMLDPLEDDPLPLPSGFRPWEPWPPEIAADRFLTILKALLCLTTETLYRCKQGVPAPDYQEELRNIGSLGEKSGFRLPEY
jgi:hypothetical protein